MSKVLLSSLFANPRVFRIYYVAQCVRFGISFWSIPIAALSVDRALCSEVLHISGVLTNTFYNRPSEVFTNQVLNFTIDIAPESGFWMMTNFWERGDRWVRGSTGDDIYHVHFEQGSPPAGFVQSGAYPLETYEVSLPWLAFASAKYLKTNQYLPAPWFHPGHDAGAHVYGTSIYQFTNGAGPGLGPAQVKWHVSSERLATAGMHPMLTIEGKTRDELRVEKAYKHDEMAFFPAGHFSVLETTNLAGWIIPTQFELRRFRPWDTASRDKSERGENGWLQVHYVGPVRSISIDASNEAQFIPDISGMIAYMYDLRYSDQKLGIQSVRYVATNRLITNRRDPMLVSLLEQRRKAVPRLFGRDALQIFLILSALAIVLYSAVRLSIYHLKRAERTKGNL